MNSELEIQAYLDNELTSAQARRVAARLNRDPQGQQLLQELTTVKRALENNPPERKLEESREFYFAQIQQRIERAEARGAETRVEIPWWRRVVAPAAAFAAIALVAFLVARDTNPRAEQVVMQEVENHHVESGGITFHSQEAGMTVVWVDRQINLR